MRGLAVLVAVAVAVLCMGVGDVSAGCNGVACQAQAGAVQPQVAAVVAPMVQYAPLQVQQLQAQAVVQHQVVQQVVAQPIVQQVVAQPVVQAVVQHQAAVVGHSATVVQRVVTRPQRITTRTGLFGRRQVTRITQ